MKTISAIVALLALFCFSMAPLPPKLFAQGLTVVPVGIA